MGTQVKRCAAMVAALTALGLTAGCSGGEAPAGDASSAPAPTGSVATSSAPGVARYVETVRDPALAEPAPPVGEQGLTEGFDDAGALSGWRVSYGEPSSGAPSTVEIADGSLRIVSSHASWLDNGHGTGVARAVDGDVTVVVDVVVQGEHSAVPTVDWSLAGVMLRTPGMQGRENWLHWTAGHVGGPVLERKATVNGVSQLTLIPIEPGSVRLLLIRTGDRVIMLHRQGDEPWQRDATYGFPQQPSAAEVMLTTQSGFEADHADMVALFDAVTITASAPSPAVVAAILAGDTSGLPS